jgi:hypothetical protein
VKRASIGPVEDRCSRSSIGTAGELLPKCSGEFSVRPRGHCGNGPNVLATGGRPLRGGTGTHSSARWRRIRHSSCWPILHAVETYSCGPTWKTYSFARCHVPGRTSRDAVRFAPGRVLRTRR